jgi:hypothetical protein
MPLVEELDQIRMAQLGGDAHLAQELFDLLWLHGDTREQHLDRDGLAIALPLGTKDGTVAAASEFFVDGVAGQIKERLLASLRRFQQEIGELLRREFIEVMGGGFDRWWSGLGCWLMDDDL